MASGELLDASINRQGHRIREVIELLEMVEYSDDRVIESCWTQASTSGAKTEMIDKFAFERGSKIGVEW